MKVSPEWIPFHRVSLAGSELNYLAEALAQNHLAGDGPFTRKASSLLEAELGARRVFLTTSCTHALEMCALLLDIKPGDEVILPSFTFVSTANAFVLRGATPRFIDIRPDTLNLDESRLEPMITPRTRAIIPVHYGGVACEMDPIMEISARHRIPVVEDNAHAIFGLYRGKSLGTIGAFGTLSFHETKSFACGEGGALVVNDPQYSKAAEIIREKGTNRTQFLRGEVDKYSWTAVGSSYLPSDLLAAFLFAQLEARERILGTRRTIWDNYYQGLRGWAVEHGVQLPSVPAHSRSSCLIFHLVMPSPASRQALIDHLRSRNIGSTFHYLPLHLSAVGRLLGGQPGDCPVTEHVSDRLLRLPLYPSLTAEQVERVISAVREFPWTTD